MYALTEQIRVLRKRIAMIAARPVGADPSASALAAWQESNGDLDSWSDRVRGGHGDWTSVGQLMSEPKRAEFVSAVIDHLVKWTSSSSWGDELDRVRNIGRVASAHVRPTPPLDQPDSVWLAYAWWRQPSFRPLGDGILFGPGFRDRLELVACIVRSGSPEDVVRLLKYCRSMPWLAIAVPKLIAVDRPEYCADLLGTTETIAIGLDLLSDIEFDRVWAEPPTSIGQDLQEGLWTGALAIWELMAKLHDARIVQPTAFALRAILERAESPIGGTSDWHSGRASLAAMRADRVLASIRDWLDGRWLQKHLDELLKAWRSESSPPTAIRGVPFVELRGLLWFVTVASEDRTHESVGLLAARDVSRIYRSATDYREERGRQGTQPRLWLPNNERWPAGSWGLVLLLLLGTEDLQALLTPVDFEYEFRRLWAEEEGRVPRRYTSSQYHTARITLTRVARVHVRVLLDAYADLQSLPGLRAGVRQLREEVRARLIDLLVKHSKQVPMDGRTDLFEHEVEWPPQFESAEPLLPRVGHFVNQLPDADRRRIVKCYALASSDPTMLTGLMATLSAESDREALQGRVMELRSQRLAASAIWVPQLQRQIASLASTKRYKEAHALLDATEGAVHDAYRRRWDPWAARLRMAMLSNRGDLKQLEAFELPSSVTDRATARELADLKRYFVAAARCETDPMQGLSELRQLTHLASTRDDYARTRIVLALNAAKSIDHLDDRAALLATELGWWDKQPRSVRDAWFAEEMACAVLIEDWKRFERIVLATPRVKLLQPAPLELMGRALLSRGQRREVERLLEEARALHGTLPSEITFDALLAAEVTSERPRLAEVQELPAAVVVLGANPHRDSQALISMHNHLLSLDREAHVIQTALTGRLSCISRLEIPRDEIRPLLEANAPVAVHFCSHGRDGCLVWEDEEGSLVELSALDIVSALTVCTARIVVLAACNSGDPARHVAQEVPAAVIGFGGSPDPEQVLTFCGILYARLAEGQSLEHSFGEAVSVVVDWGTVEPVLEVGPSVEPGELYLVG